MVGFEKIDDFRECVLLTKEEWEYIENKTGNVYDITDPQRESFCDMTGINRRVYNFQEISEKLKNFL